MPKERPVVTASFLTADPNYYKASALHRILTVILSHKNYIPESISGGQDRVTVTRFGSESVELLSQAWERTSGPIGWDLERKRPHIEIDIWRAYPLFDPFIIHVERDFLKDTYNLSGFVKLLKELYDVIHPAYGEALLAEEMRWNPPVEGKRNRLALNLKRALPSIYWATFLGPEYVDMFGRDRVLSAQVHLAEPLPDGGVLLLLTESPFDFLSDRERFEKLQLDTKKHLGVEAFDTGDPRYQGKVPMFRFLTEKESLRQEVFGRGRESRSRESGILSRVTREEWHEWLRNNPRISKELVNELGGQGVKLDFSPESLIRLDDYIEKLKKQRQDLGVELLQKVAAYVSQVLIRETGAVWSFEGSDTPTLKLGTAEVSPLVRAQKVLHEGERFEPWYRFIKEDIVQGSQPGS